MSDEKPLFQKDAALVLDMVHIVGVMDEEKVNKEYIKQHYTPSAIELSSLERAIRVMKALTFAEHYEPLRYQTFEILLPTDKLAPILFRWTNTGKVIGIAPRGPVGQGWHGLNETTEKRD